MRNDAILGWIRDERLSLADFLDGLERHEWRVDSLCQGWTVHDVAAHMTLSTRTTLRMAIREAVRARGSFDRMEATLARERAARFTPEELVAQLRQTAGSAHRTPGGGPHEVRGPVAELLIAATGRAAAVERVT